MFSYLRPNNRRSAIPPTTTAPPQATSSRSYHGASTSPLPSSSSFSPLPPQPSQGNAFNEPSPVSPDPPTLPPIPRVASQHERNTSVTETFWSQEQETEEIRRQSSLREEPSARPPTIALTTDPRPFTTAREHSEHKSFLTETAIPSAALEPPRATQSRQKRPIDLAYESMRAYSEPPRRQSFRNVAGNAPFLPHPTREPPPPPSRLPSLPPPQRQAPPPPVRAQTQAPPVVSQKHHGKAKLNLLNPISLLARRRSSHAVEEAYAQSQSNPRLPDDFDPRIRGKVVHDFSAPRPSRPVSSTEQTKEMEGLSEALRKRPSPRRGSATDQEGHSPGSNEKEHTPVFRENFEDDVEPWSSDMESPAKQRTSAFMYQVSLQTTQPPDPSSLPAFARNLPSNILNNMDTVQTNSPPSNPHLEILLEPPTANQRSATSSPPMSPPKTRSRATSVNDPHSSSPGPPQRFKSNSSRFSFDLAGVGSAAQERLLEEKHRQKAKRKERESIQSIDQDLSDDDDAYANYEDDDNDGLEERIPGVNADEDDPNISVLQQTLESSQFISPNKSSFDSVASRVSTNLTSLDTPRDDLGHGISYGASKSTPDLIQLQYDGRENNSSKEGDLRPKSTSGVTQSISNAQLQQQHIPPADNPTGLPHQADYEEDDMYFDDGIIEDFNDDEAQPFDESVFDDENSRVYGLPIRDLKPLLEPINTGNLHEQATQQDIGNNDWQLDSPNDDDTMEEMRDSVADLNQSARATSKTTGLTQDNLGLHDRLAFAANQAALEGRFNRTHSQASTHESHEGPNSSQGTATQENHMISNMDGLLISQGIEDDDNFAFDDMDTALTEAEDDDPIIAAANAEALENDDEGFYGQEFGFFARKPGSSQAEYANGGYFGARALEGIHRMNSGRDNFLEPSLTPITERSEWSNRNSMVSLGLHGFPLSSQYQSNPQLTDLMRVQEGEEMSLEQLRKLRRGAWGGSNNSLPSGSNSPNGGSPLTYLPSGMVAPMMQQTNSNGSLISPSSQNLAGSFHSFSSAGHTSSHDSDPSPSNESPTIAISPSNSGLLLHPPQPMGPPPPPPTESSPVKRTAMNPPRNSWVSGHSRTSSGAESVSYREENGRWFCEKTRLIDAETGEVEVLGRSVVEGGRI
ncbi:hypothetical protein ACLMJK_005535 [Lecanora helva]